MEQIKGFVFFDLDGTLLDGNSDVTIEVSQAMAALRENGYIPVIATGRSNVEVKEIQTRTGIDSVITMNGQHVVFDGQTIASEVIAAEIAERLRDFAHSFGHDLGFYTPDLITVTSHSPMAIETYQFVGVPLPEINPELFTEREINMLLVIGQGHDADYQAAFPDLNF